MGSAMNLKFGRQAVSVDQAQELLRGYHTCTAVERVPLARSFGRRLAEDLFADHPVPHFRRSGVDGYAVLAADIECASPEHPVPLRVIEQIPSGTVPQKVVTTGHAARIMTGASLPEGADTVVMLEMTDTQPEHGELASVWIKKSLPAGQNVTPVAGEIKSGERLLEKGALIGPGEAAILATFGYSSVPVYGKPRAAIFSTGSELLNVEEPLSPSRIRNSNSYMLAAQVEAAGGVPLIMPPLPDDAKLVQKAIEEAFTEADLVITSGGVSVGDYDVLVDVFGRWEGKLLFNKVSMRPGTPTSAALWKDKLLFALSGNPGASFVGFELFAKPALKALQGCATPHPETVTAFLDVDYDKGSAYPRYVRGTTRVENGTLWVRPAGLDKSSIMVSIKDADCLILLPAGGSGFPKGSKVLVYRI